MGGGITFESEYEVGTKFTFQILNKDCTQDLAMQENNDEDVDSSFRPLIVPSAEPKIVCTSSNPLTLMKTRPKSKIRLLVVDDEYICGYVMKKIIESLNYDVDLVIKISHYNLIGTIRRRGSEICGEIHRVEQGGGMQVGLYGREHAWDERISDDRENQGNCGESANSSLSHCWTLR